MSVDLDVQIDEKIEKKITLPRKYKVIFLNDDVTPIDFVVDLLKNVFKHSQESAEQITLTVHNEGAAIVGIYNYEIAEQKSVEAVNLSRAQGFPLNVKLEQE